jgi:hypothetical protein
MSVFNPRILIRFLLLTQAAALTACSLDGTQESPAERAANSGYFFVDSSSVNENMAYLTDGIRTAADLDYRACIKRSDTKTLIEEGQKFEIEPLYDSTLAKKSVISNKDGCFAWSNKISFNPNVKGQYVEARFKITGLGNYPGVKEISFAVNPWDQKYYSVVSDAFDPNSMVTFAEAVATLNGTKTSGPDAKAIGSDKAFIVINDLRLNTVSLAAGNPAKLSLNLRTDLQARFTNKAGHPRFEAIPFGSLKVEMGIISSMPINGKEERRMLSPMTEAKLLFSNGYFNPSGVLEFKKIPQLGQFYLALRISPVDPKSPLAVYEGVFLWGNYLSVQPSSFSRAIIATTFETPDFSLNNFLAEAKPTDAGDSVFLDSTYFIPKTNGVWVTQKEFPSDSIFNQRRRLIFTINIYSAIDNQPVRSQNFEVTKLNGEKVTLKSNEAGALNFYEDLEYNWLGQECSYTKPITVRALQADFQKVIPIEYNPWNQQAGAVLDVSGLDKPSLEKDCLQERSTIVPMMSGFVKQNLFADVDAHLNLKLTKRFNINVWANVNRPTKSSLFNKQQAYIPPGYYILKYAYYDPLVTPEKVLFATKGLVKADAYGAFMANIDVSTMDPIFQFYNLNLAIEVIPANQIKAAQLCGQVKGCLDRIDKQDFIKLSELGLQSEEALLDPSMHIENKTYYSPFMLSDRMPSISFKAETAQKNLFEKLYGYYQADLKLHTEKLSKINPKAAFVAKQKSVFVDLANSKSANGFIENFNKGSFGPWPSSRIAITKEELQKAVANSTINKYLEPWICAYWINGILKNQPAITNNPAKLRMAKQLCETQVQSSAVTRSLGYKYELSNLFEVHYVYFVENPQNTERTRFVNASRQYNFHKSSSFSRDRSYSEGYSLGIELEPVLAYGLSFGKLAFGGQGAYSWNWTTGEGRHETFAADISGTIDKLVMPIQVSKYEKCALIRPNSAAAKSGSYFMQLLNHKPALAEVQKALEKGLLICEGFKRGSRKFNETFHFINQTVSTSDGILDSGQVRPFVELLRSDLEFEKFTKFLQFDLTRPDSSGPDGQLLNDLAHIQEYVFGKSQEVFPLSSGDIPGVIIQSQ